MPEVNPEEHDPPGTDPPPGGAPTNQPTAAGVPAAEAALTDDDNAPVAHSAREAYRAPEMGPSAMKAFAHPLRMALYQRLVDHGPATATTLGKALGESSGQTSYHLRQLERHGFVAEDPERGTGRERWWQSRGFSVQATQLIKDPDTAAPARLFMEQVEANRTRTVRDWVRRAVSDEPEWVAASADETTTTSLTASELAALNEELYAVLERHVDVAREAGGADREQARPVRIYLIDFPLTSPEPPDPDPAE